MPPASPNSADRSIPFFSPWIVALAILLSGAALEAPGREPPWLTGAPLRQRLRTPASGNWQGMQLGELLGRIARAQRVAIVLDRRIDPGRKVDWETTLAPLEELIASLAASQGLGAWRLGNVIYVGPREAAGKLRTLAELRRQEIKRSPKDLQKRLLSERAWRWPEATAPAELVEALAEEAKVSIVGRNRMVHDLWPAAELPPLAWVDRLLLATIQFDLTFVVGPDARTLELTDLPDYPAVVRRYHLGPSAEETATRWRRDIPQAVVEASDGEVVVTASLEDHERIAPSRRQANSRPPKKGPRPERYTLKVQAVPVQALLAHFERMLNVKIVYDRERLAAAGASLDRPISLEVKDASLDDLLRAALAPAKLRHSRQGDQIRIEADDSATDSP